MRVCLPLLLAAALAGEEPAPLAETARGLVALQRPDGGWGLARPVRAWPLPPQRVGEPPLPPIRPEFAERERAAVFSRAAEALWLARQALPAAGLAAARAQDLAARALLANRGLPPTPAEAVAFLRAERARGAAAEGAAAEAVEPCRKALTAAIVASPAGGALGVGVGGNIDLQLTWLAAGLERRDWHAWLPRGHDGPWPRVARYQPLLPPTVTDVPGRIEPPVDFVDGSPWAAALVRYAHQDVQAWMQRQMQAEGEGAPELERVLAWVDVCDRRWLDPPEAWWRACLVRWQTALLRRTQCHATPAGTVRLWDLDRAEEENVRGLLWLLGCERIAAGERDRDWQKRCVDGALLALAAHQEAGGGWASTSGGTAATALACLAYLGAGYDHKMPSRHRKTLRRGVDALLAVAIADGGTSDRALRLMTLAEAYAMSVDPDLRRPVEERAVQLLAARRPDGLWSEAPGGPPDWTATGLAVLALKSAHAGGIRLEFTAVAAAAAAGIDPGRCDDPAILAWQGVVLVCLGPEAAPRAAALAERLAKLLPAEPPPAVQWPAAIAMFKAGRPTWLTFVAQQRVRPLPEQPDVEGAAQRLLADEVLSRWDYVERDQR